MKRKEKFQRCLSKVQLLVFQIFLTTTIYSQTDKLPTTEDAASIKKGFPIILQQVPSNFDKIRSENSTEFFGIVSYTSSIKLMPNQKATVPENIYFMVDKDGKSLKAYTENIPYSIETIVKLLAPMLKQNNMIEVMPQRSDSTKIVRSFKNTNAVLELVELPDNSGVAIMIGKLYYYYTPNVKPISAKPNTPTVVKKIEKKPVNDGGEKVLKGLAKLYNSAINKLGSFGEYKTGTPEKINLTDRYNLESQLQFDSIQKAYLFVTKATEGINGVSFEISAANTSLYINALNKMATAAETLGEVKIEKRQGVTRYSLQSRSLKTEILSLLDFDETGYSDRIICNTIYNN